MSQWDRQETIRSVLVTGAGGGGGAGIGREDVIFHRSEIFLIATWHMKRWERRRMKGRGC